MSAFRPSWFLATWLASLGWSCPTALSADTQLLSITGIKLQPLKSGSQPSSEYIASFDIKTWGVRVIAVCNIPDGWTISAGKNANPEGVPAGSAGEGVAFLDADKVHQLADFFLVQVDDYHPADRGDCVKGSFTPASFAGNFYIGEYGSEDQPRQERLLPSNIRLDAASKCPDPR